MLIADTNEYHPLENAEVYRDSREPDGTNHPVVIMRVCYSITHIDLAYARSAHLARQAGLHIGHYAYLVAGVDAGAQGRFFAHLVKNTRGFLPGDSIWCDDEEGSGNQAPRVLQFLDAVHQSLHEPAAADGTYSGAAFWQAHLGSLPSNLNRWVAAYGAADPRLPGEDLWQFTDSRNVPGVVGPCDASIYKGTLEQFLTMVGAKAPAPSGKFLEDDMQQLVPGSRLALVWSDGAKTIRISSDAPAATPVPWHIAWYTEDSNSRGDCVVGTVDEPKIPGGRGCIVHRDDKPGDPSAEYQLSVVPST